MKRRIFSLLLAFSLLFALLPLTAYASTVDEIKDQIRTIHNQSTEKAPNGSWNQWCGAYTGTLIHLLGITTELQTADGRDMFDMYKNEAVTSGGYNVKAYSASEYSLSDALNTICENGTKDVYNILVGSWWGDGDLAEYGHSIFIHAILNGTVYYSESFPYRGYIEGEGVPTALSISQFCHLYEDLLGHKVEGVIHFYKEHPYFAKCTEYPTYGNITITKDTYIKTLPCSRKTHEESDDIRKAKVGEPFVTTKLYQNTSGNYWYQVIVGDEIGYIFAGDAHIDSVMNDVTINNVSAPTSLKLGSRFSINGDISSKYCKIANVYGSIHKPGAQFIYHCQDEIQGHSYSLLNSKIDMAMLFNELPAGSYYYEIDVTVPYYYSYDGKTLSQSEECFYIVFQEFTVK